MVVKSTYWSWITGGRLRFDEGAWVSGEELRNVECRTELAFTKLTYTAVMTPDKVERQTAFTKYVCRRERIAEWHKTAVDASWTRMRTGETVKSYKFKK